jgi:hypothetical protein
MSNKVFCPKCYKSTSYESSPAPFCSHCGKPFNGSFESNANESVTIIPPKSVNVIKRMPIVEDDNEELIQVPNIDKIEVIIDPNLRPNRQKLESLAGTRKEDPLPLRNSSNKKPSKKLSKKEAERIWLESFPKTNRNSPQTIEGNE